MKTVQITIETAKGREQVTTWGMFQDRPLPSLTAGCGRLQWQGGNGIFPEYGQPARGLEDVYKAVLLREGYSDETATGDRDDYAGFLPYRSDDPVPGEIVFRGRGLGETEANIDLRAHGAGVWWKVRGSEHPTATEKALLVEQVEPAIVAAIRENAAALRAEAVDGIRDTVKEQLADARARLDKLEREAADAINQL